MRRWTARGGLAMLAMALGPLSAGCASRLPAAEAVARWQVESSVQALQDGGASAGEPSEKGAPQVDPGRVEALRAQVDQDSLRRARQVCLALLARDPDAPELLWRAARAEVDLLLLDPGAPQERRDLIAESGLAYARRARRRSPQPGADLLAQLAFSLGTTTHLLPMGERSDRANETLAVAEAALARDPESTVALATVATLRLRLATLPWIARVMASDAPEGSVEEARRLALRCLDLEPSVEHRLLFAKTLIAADEEEKARTVLRVGLEEPARFPRDLALRGAVKGLLAELE